MNSEVSNCNVLSSINKIKQVIKEREFMASVFHPGLVKKIKKINVFSLLQANGPILLSFIIFGVPKIIFACCDVGAPIPE